MGFDVHVTVTLKKSPSEAVMSALDHQFEAANHQRGSATVTLTEHVSMANEHDAVEFVRGLVLDAVPAGSTIAEISVVAD